MVNKIRFVNFPARFVYPLFIVAIVLFCLSPPLMAVPEDADYVGEEACLMCHDAYGESFSKTVHGRANIAGEAPVVSCESCHGPGSKHTESGEPADIFNPGKANSYEQTETCNTCHEKLKGNFGFSHLDIAGGCSDCHIVHSENEQLLVKQGSDLCFGCHVEVRGVFSMPSHHPVLEDRLQCYDCHQVHGGGAKFTSMDTERELCLSCHVDKQGPFVFEHDPVNEDCSICHNPHGSVADNLLIQADPFICMSCHPLHFHTSLDGVEEESSIRLHPDRGGLFTKDGFKRSMLTKCTQCHTQIHGSDLPAQSISGPGGLTR